MKYHKFPVEISLASQKISYSPKLSNSVVLSPEFYRNSRMEKYITRSRAANNNNLRDSDDKINTSDLVQYEGELQLSPKSKYSIERSKLSAFLGKYLKLLKSS